MTTEATPVSAPPQVLARGQKPFYSPMWLARPVLVDPSILDRLEIGWEIVYFGQVRHIVMTVKDWARAEREQAVLY